MNKLQELQSEIDALRHENEIYKEAQAILQLEIKHKQDQLDGAKATIDLLNENINELQLLVKGKEESNRVNEIQLAMNISLIHNLRRENAKLKEKEAQYEYKINGIEVTKEEFHKYLMR